MKSIYLLLSTVLLFSGCGKPTEQSGQAAESTEGDSPNEALYNQVMDVHDEVMPRMEDIYKLKKDLQEQISTTPDMVIERKQQLEAIISSLDSADHAMMDWMHKFNPPADSVDQEKVREYLESEMERVKKVRDLMNESIDKAKEVASKN